MTLFMLSLTGLPPTVGFIGKFFIFRAAIDADLIWLALVGVITSLISAYYYLRVVVVMYMQEGEPETSVGRWVSVSVFLTALLTLVFGLLPGTLLQAAETAGLLAYLP
jgi:NADH-quinone oxidoreductase subunit N